jgi:Tol biopolymer transport system component
MIKRSFFLIGFIICLFVSVCRGIQSNPRVPTIDDLLTLKIVGATQISPDGKWVAYTVTQGDLKQDAYVTHIWLVEIASQRNIQLTRGDKSASNPRWSPNGEWLAFLSNRLEDKNQIFAINPFGGKKYPLLCIIHDRPTGIESTFSFSA